MARRRLGTVEYYRGPTDRLWRWRVRSSSGLRLADGAAYMTFGQCQRAMCDARDALLYVPATGGPSGRKAITATAIAR